MRYFLEIAYKGTKYHGWQIQKNAFSVQEQLNKILTQVFRKPIETLGSGRTDAGVHASMQIVHFDIDEEIDGLRRIPHINSFLPKDIRIIEIKKVVDAAHARFDATERSYIYKIIRKPNPFTDDLAYYYHRDIDLDKMQQASKLMLEHNDYGCFCKSRAENKTNLCEVTRSEWEIDGYYLYFHITANRFLRGMVRTVVGTLLMVGEGKLSIEEFKNILKSEDRTQAGPSVPAQGLYLCNVVYPKEIFI